MSEHTSYDPRSGQRAELTPLAGWLIERTVAMLPRDHFRYRQEFEADCLQLPAMQQIGYAFRTFLHGWSLRRALSAPLPTPSQEPLVPARVTRPPLHCRLNRLHKWKWQSTDDGHQYRRCQLCGRDDDGLQYSWMSTTPLRIPRR